MGGIQVPDQPGIKQSEEQKEKEPMSERVFRSYTSCAISRPGAGIDHHGTQPALVKLAISWIFATRFIWALET
jgi:hypothetical protein